jgi:hypothetical protein
MKRTLLALAIAGVSLAAAAGPPGPPLPIDVKVVSPVPMPVTDVPQWVTPDRMYFAGSGGGIVGDAVQLVPLSEDAVLTSYDVQVHVDDAVAAICTVDAVIVTDEDEFVAALGRVVGLQGRDSRLSVDLPNVYVQANQGLRVKIEVDGAADTLCHFDAQIRGVKVP